MPQRKQTQRKGQRLFHQKSQVPDVKAGERERNMAIFSCCVAKLIRRPDTQRPFAEVVMKQYFFLKKLKFVALKSTNI